MRRPLLIPGLVLALCSATAACGGNGGGGGDGDAKAHGPIKIWLSNNAEELAWGKQMVAAWNAAHPKEKVTAQEIPAGKSSEEVIGAAITAGNAPCLVYNTSPAAVPQFTKQGGLVPLNDFPGATKYLTDRTGGKADQYKAADGKFYQLPWKSNPVMIFYNKQAFAKAGLDAEHPQLASYDQFLAAARQVVAKGGAQYAIWPSPTSEFYQPWFDFYPLFIAGSGKQLVSGGKAQFDSDAGVKVGQFWRTLYTEKLASPEKYTGDAFADGKAAMAIVGPWAIASYGAKVSWGAVPVPTPGGTPADQVKTFPDAKNVAMYTACKNRGTAWDLMKFSTSREQDGKLLEITGQMPMRTDLAATYPRYFAAHPEYKAFAAQADRTVEVPQVPNSVEIWQTFRDAYSAAVIFGKQPVPDAFRDAATKITKLAKQP
jgi:multiple sugar transport system substrate-binding protein